MLPHSRLKNRLQKDYRRGQAGPAQETQLVGSREGDLARISRRSREGVPGGVVGAARVVIARDGTGMGNML